MFGLIPKETAFFEMFQKAAHNMIEGSRLLKEMMEDFRNPVEQARRIKDIRTHRRWDYPRHCPETESDIHHTHGP